MCPRGIYSHTVRDMDRQIVASTNDRKETQSTTPRLGPAVPAGLILNTILEIIQEIGDPHVVKSFLGDMTMYLPGAMLPPTRTRRAHRSSTPSHCLLPCGKINDGAAVQVRLKAANIHEDSKSSHTAARIAPSL